MGAAHRCTGRLCGRASGRAQPDADPGRLPNPQRQHDSQHRLPLLCQRGGLTMPLPTPNLDNRRFADIVAEARALVPRYTKEWTDLNETDPGMTLIELFGWMTEM